MSTAALALVLASAATHALWNTLIADAPDTHARSAVSLLTAAVLAAPLAVLTWHVDAAAVPYIVASAALELVYWGLLATAYTRAGLTVVYPVARGSSPVIVLIVSVAALGVALSAGQVLGVLAVAAGILLVGARGVGDRSAVPLALAVGACIAGYTLVDKHGLEHAGALAYFQLLLIGIAVPFASVVALRSGAGALRQAVSGRAVVAGIGLYVAYALTLAALERAEAAPVAALRETSVVMATLAAIAMGRERAPLRRLAGAAAVVAGAAAIALS